MLRTADCEPHVPSKTQQHEGPGGTGTMRCHGVAARGGGGVTARGQAVPRERRGLYPLSRPLGLEQVLRRHRKDGGGPSKLSESRGGGERGKGGPGWLGGTENQRQGNGLQATPANTHMHVSRTDDPEKAETVRMNENHTNHMPPTGNLLYAERFK